MRRSSASLRNSGGFTSPGTPEYGDTIAGGTPKGWSSERVPLPVSNTRRHTNVAGLIMPFYSGRTLPSKWDDAERWITSPLSGYGVGKNSVAQPHRRPKSKSGPLGPPGGLMYMPYYSPPVAALEGRNARNFTVGSPFTTGVLLPDGVSLQYGAYTGGGKSSSLIAESRVERSCKAMQPSDLLSESSLPSSRDGKPDSTKEAETMVSREVSRRDMATQMSPDGSIQSSPGSRSPSSTFPPLLLPFATASEIRDVQVDKGAAVRMQHQKHEVRKTKRSSPDVQHSDPPWDAMLSSKNTSKLQREEAKISAWENLQKAKAEAAIRKLEMKIEKKRSESMDKILNKLRVAELKAQEMRSSITESCRARRRMHNRVGSLKKYVKKGSLVSCFSCHAH